MGNEIVNPIGPPKIGLQLRESGDGEFTTMDVLAGLCGVCQALDEVAGNCDDANVVHRLSIEVSNPRSSTPFYSRNFGMIDPRAPAMQAEQRRSVHGGNHRPTIARDLCARLGQ